MDYIKISQQLETLVNDVLPKAINALIPLEKDKAICKGQYDKKLAQTMIRAHSGINIMFDHELVQWTSVTGIEKIAKGVCFQESIDLDLAESALKRQHVLIASARDKASVLQSLLRYQD